MSVVADKRIFTKTFTPEELADLILSSKSTRETRFYGGKLPRGDYGIGTSHIEEEVIHISEAGGGMRGNSFCRSSYYEEGKFISSRDLPTKDELIADIRSNAIWHGSEVFMVSGKTREKIGKVLRQHKTQ